MGHVDLVDEAIRVRENAATVAQEASGYQADGADALENVTVEKVVEIGCWMCQTLGLQLRVCRVCNKVTPEKIKIILILLLLYSGALLW